MGTPHKHAALIKAWADGAEIQAYAGVDKWVVVERPVWYTDTQYRVKPKDDIEMYRFVSILRKPSCNEEDGLLNVGVTPMYKRNLKLTFDGETGKLKSAEVLK